MSSSPKAVNEASEPESKKSKSNTPLEETEPTFDLGSQELVVNEISPDSPSVDFSSDMPTPFDNLTGGPDNLPLPKTAAPTTDLKINESIDVNNNNNHNSTNGLALPKRDDKKKSKTSGKPGQNSSSQPKDGTAQSVNRSSQPKTDPNKMQDVLFTAGVDIREEEALLNSSVNASKSQTQLANTKVPNHPPFLHPDQVDTYMKKICREQNFTQSFGKNPDVLRIMSTACEMYMKDIITNSLVISRHRRKAVKINSGRRSDVSATLKTIAVTQKKEEERRVKKRITLGLEKEDLENKLDSEETLHRASNVTAGLRAGSKKQYGWLKSSISKPTSMGSKTFGKVASAVAARGDSGLRFREAREEPGIVMRDLLFALENRRNGVHNVISKGYARIRD